MSSIHFKEAPFFVIAANIVVCPIANIFLRGWLQNYIYHTTLAIGILILLPIWPYRSLS